MSKNIKLYVDFCENPIVSIISFLKTEPPIDEHTYNRYIKRTKSYGDTPLDVVFIKFLNSIEPQIMTEIAIPSRDKSKELYEYFGNNIFKYFLLYDDDPILLENFTEDTISYQIRHLITYSKIGDLCRFILNPKVILTKKIKSELTEETHLKMKSHVSYTEIIQKMNKLSELSESIRYLEMFREKLLKDLEN